MDFAEIFNNFAFPAATVIALMIYIVKAHTDHREDMQKKDDMIAKLNEQHDAETNKFTDALNRNTVVLERLCVLIGDKEGTK